MIAKIHYRYVGFFKNLLMTKSNCKMRVLQSAAYLAVLLLANAQTRIFPDCASGNETPSCTVGGAVINNGSVGGYYLHMHLHISAISTKHLLSLYQANPVVGINPGWSFVAGPQVTTKH